MKCPFLREVSVRYCMAFPRKIMIPSGREEEEYCSCEGFAFCEVYKNHQVCKFPGDCEAETAQLALSFKREAK